MRKVKQAVIFTVCIMLLVSTLGMQKIDLSDENMGKNDMDILSDENVINDTLGLLSEAAILVEAETGSVLYEKNPDKILEPASVTKIMTLLLIYEALEQGRFTKDDYVTVSQHAASMGGSQCYFENGEKQTVSDMIKCIEVASGNDAAVAMAEFVAGSEAEFVNMMNEKARELGMTNTNFVNACGLSNEKHYTTARDISVMSRELITKYPDIFNYSGIWMDTITHVTKKGETEFGLNNTNKFLRQYDGATGLKTGFTSSAGYCMSATAKRNDITLIAVIMKASTKEIRNEEAGKLLNYGFSKCTVFRDNDLLNGVKYVKIKNGISDFAQIKAEDSLVTALIDCKPSDVTKNVILQEEYDAPVYENDILGKVELKIGEEIIYETPVYAAETVEKKRYINCIYELLLKTVFILE